MRTVAAPKSIKYFISMRTQPSSFFVVWSTTTLYYIWLETSAPLSLYVIFRVCHQKGTFSVLVAQKSTPTTLVLCLLQQRACNASECILTSSKCPNEFRAQHWTCSCHHGPWSLFRTGYQSFECCCCLVVAKMIESQIEHGIFPVEFLKETGKTYGLAMFLAIWNST